MQQTRETQWSIWLVQLVDWLLASLLLILPLMIGPAGATPIAKTVGIVVVALLLIMALSLRACERASAPQLGTRFRQPLSISLIVWLVYVTGSTFGSVDPRVSFWGTKQHVLGLLVYLAFGLVSLTLADRLPKNPTLWTKLAGALALGTLVVSLHGLFQWFGHDLPVYQATHLFDIAADKRRAFATFGNPVHFTVYLAFVLPLLLAGWFVARTRLLRVGLLITLSIGTLALFASIAGHVGAQGLINGLYGLFLGGGIIWLWCVRRHRPNILALQRLASWLVFALIIGSATLIAAPQPLAPLLGKLERFVPHSEAFAARYPNWSIARITSAERPLTGSGLETYQQVYHQNYLVQLSQFQPTESRLDRAHSLGLDWIITTGWLGWLLLVTLLGVTLWSAWRTIFDPDRPAAQRLFAGGFIYALLGYLGQLLLNFSSQSDLLVLFVGLGGLLAIQRPALPDKPDQSDPKIEPFAGNYWGLGLVVFGLGVAALWWFGVRLWVSELETKAGILSIQNQTLLPQDQRMFAAGLERLERAKRHAPDFPDADLLLAEGYRRAGDFAASLRVIEEGQTLHPADYRYLEAEAELRAAWVAVDAAERSATEHFFKEVYTKTAFWTPLFREQLRFAAAISDRAALETIKATALAWSPNHYLNWDTEIGLALVETGQMREALPYLQTGLASRPTGEGWRAVGVAEINQGNASAAREAYQTCLKYTSNDLRCWLGWLEAARALGAEADYGPILNGITQVNPALGRQVRASANQNK